MKFLDINPEGGDPDIVEQVAIGKEMETALVVIRERHPLVSYMTLIGILEMVKLALNEDFKLKFDTERYGPGNINPN